MGTMTTDTNATATQDALPSWFPRWASDLGELYFSGTTSMFVLGGNTFDLVAMDGSETPRFGGLAEFLAEQLFGRWDLVLHYDLARGLRCLAGADEKRLAAMVALTNQRVGDLTKIGKEPAAVLGALDRFVQRNIMAPEGERTRLALLIDHASYVVPRGERMSSQSAAHIVTLLNWAQSPYVKRINMAFVLMDSRLGEVSERITTNPHVATLEIGLPEQPDRRRFLATATRARQLATFSDYGLEELASLTAGVSFTDLEVLVQSSIETGRRLDAARFSVLKKRLIERQAQDLVEFVAPRWGLDTVIGHDAAKARLRDDAELIRRGALSSVPMGYLVCGPVGTGKSFLAECTAGDIGIPCLKLKSFRSKYVGETEANLQRVLSVLRGMGPVLVMVDEADAMLGDRDQGGDSGVGSRVFGMIASQMGDTKYRGRILWMLLTARPDLLPIDLKRQGRAEVHIPLFYPTDDAEIRALFVGMAKKNGATLRPEDVPPIPFTGQISGGDWEALVGRAQRESLIAGSPSVTAAHLAAAVQGFLPSTQSLERELQEITAIIECTDRAFLPPSAVKRLEVAGGREKLQERLNVLKQLVAGQ